LKSKEEERWRTKLGQRDGDREERERGSQEESEGRNPGERDRAGIRIGLWW
jgi:hypothetical protein